MVMSEPGRNFKKIKHPHIVQKTRIKSKCITDLNVKKINYTAELLDESMGEFLFNFSFRKG